MGTPFNSGQLNKLQTLINIGVATALPNVVAKLEPKSVLKALDGKGEIFAGHLEAAIEQAINRMFVLTANGSTTITLTERHDPDSFYQTREGLYVWDGFRNLVVAKAKPTEAGTVFNLNHALLSKDMCYKEIEDSLPNNHIFGDSTVSAIVAGLIAAQPGGKEGKLLNNGYANLFYTNSCVVYVYWDAGGREWDVNAWGRDDLEWFAGSQVFSPATVT